MEDKLKDTVAEVKTQSARPTVSAILEDGSIVELLYDPTKHTTLFCVAQDGEFRYEHAILAHGHRLVPYSPNNNLIKNDVVLLPSKAEEYRTEEELIVSIQGFLHRYVDVSPLFEKIASYYVLFTWVYDDFNELPYLRVRGDYGSGKTRFLLTLGSLCYKPIFASGASTVSPLFRILDAFRGTLIIDEADFRLSDERAELVKILNNGNAKGFPVLRSEMTQRKEFDPRAYAVFGPKLVATRGFFVDRALESRFITEEMGHTRLREDIPINMPSEYKHEALAIRNKLLLFRFRNLRKRRIEENLVDRSIEPRLNQIFIPLLSIIEDRKTRDDMQELARRYQREIVSDRGTGMEGQILEIVKEMRGSSVDGKLAIKDITNWFVDRHGDDYERKITSKWIGNTIRKKLGLKTEKIDSNYYIAASEGPKLDLLFERYGIVREGGEASPQERAERSDGLHGLPGH
jgi:hypothetical protein